MLCSRPVKLKNVKPLSAKFRAKSTMTYTGLFMFLLQVVEKLENVKQIEVKPNGRAEFSMDMKLWDPNSTITLYKVSSYVLQDKLFKTNHGSNKKEIKKSNLTTFLQKRMGQWFHTVMMKI